VVLKKSTKIISAIVVIAIVLGLVVSVTADRPWTSYGYDWFNETYPVQSGYVVDRIITSSELGLTTPMRSPRDVFVYESGDEVSIFIVDADNDRIIITDENFEDVRELKTFEYSDDYKVENFLPRPDVSGNIAPDDVDAYWAEVGKIGTQTTLRGPTGIFVQNFRGETRVYIADHHNERVIACDLDGKIWMEYRRPDPESFDPNASFRPSKVLADAAGNVYVCLTTITQGAVVFNEDGGFRGFYGANRVIQGATARLNYFLRFFMSREMMARRVRPTPIEFSNFTIDNDQFIYTVTETRGENVGIVKKINPSGQDVFSEEGKDDWIWGAFMSPYVYGRTFMSMMVDISVDEKGDIYLLDRESGQVFQYDKEGYLMFVFGGKGEQKGLFTAPVSVETHNGKVYVLDSTKNSLTVFKPTEFGELVLEAMSLFNRGLYEESMKPWEEVLKRDANYYMAYNGMGNAKLSVGDFDEALSYFYLHSSFGYQRAFKDFRIHYMRENFNRILAVAVAAVALIAVTHFTIKFIRKRKAKS